MTQQSSKRKKSAARQNPDGSQPSPVDPGPDGFARFMATFPAREGGHDVDAARAAWERAAARAGPEAIIAGARAYSAATAGRQRRYVMSARRWLYEGRWRDDAKPSANLPKVHPLVWIEHGRPEWWAWAQFRGKTPPLDRRGGWRFPSRWPPTIQAAE